MRVLITGATRGIGLAIVEALADDDNVIYLGCRDTLCGQNMSYMIAGRKGLGPEAIIPVKLDVTDAESIAAAAASVAASGHKLDAIVNNAGVLLERDGTDLDAIVEPTLRVNVDGVVAVTTTFLGLIRDGGQVINVSSGAGTRATSALDATTFAELESASTPAALRASITRLSHDAASKPHRTSETPIYNISKCAVNYYTRLLARQVPRLRVNACSPGFCRTEIAGECTYAEREPKDASLGASVVLKLLRAQLGRGSGGFFKESSKPGTPIKLAQSVAEPWFVRDGGETAHEKKAAAAVAASAAASTFRSPPQTSHICGKRKLAEERDESQGTVPLAVKQDLAARVVKAIKRTEHTERGRPFTTLEVPMRAEVAGALLPGLRKCTCEGAAAVLAFLPLPKTVHPVKSRVRTLCVGPDDDGFVYSWAGYEGLEASYVKSSAQLKLKVRTLLVGYGVPTAFPQGDAHYDGYVACKTLPELRQWTQKKLMEF